MEFTIHPELPATDIQRARAWYKEKLGLDPVAVGGEPLDPEVEPSDSELLCDTGTEEYDIDDFTEEDGTPYFRNGVLISLDGEKTACFKDSEGNILAIGST